MYYVVRGESVVAAFVDEGAVLGEDDFQLIAPVFKLQLVVQGIGGLDGFDVVYAVAGVLGVKGGGDGSGQLGGATEFPSRTHPGVCAVEKGFLDVVVVAEVDFQVAIHTDSLNESGYVQKTISAFEGRTIHAYHAEGAGGGHAPDIMIVTGEENVLPSSTNATKPYTKNSVAELLWMTIGAHNLNPNAPEDVAFAESRIREETIAAEDILHDMGAISMMSSDSQGMGRVGETILRTWQLASKMKKQRGPLPEDKPGNDNERVLRYLAKYTINPAKTNGLDDYIGSLQEGRLADVVVWDPRFFGVKARMVYKSGAIVYSYTGDPNASTEWTQPMWYRRQYGSYGNNINRMNKIFVTKAAIENGFGDKVPYSKDKLLPVKNCRNLTKKDMVRNSFLPNISIDPETYQVFIDGERITCEPAEKLPSTQLYFFR